MTSPIRQIGGTMRALTVCQPYAELICLPEDDPRHKRVENRTWYTGHRGLIYLHAGKSREWLDIEDGIDQAYKIPVKSMAFGAVVATVELVDCVHLDQLMKPGYFKKYPWLATQHQHINGPYCWLLQGVTVIGPWPCRGALGLFTIDDDELDQIATREIQGA